MTELRPITETDVEPLVRWRVEHDAAGEHSWMGFQSTHDYRERAAADRFIDDDGGALAIVDGDVLCGDVTWRRIPTASSRHSACWNIGITLLPEHRGKGHGTVAQRLLADYLFAHTPLQRVEASTDIDNIAEQRSLEKAGFTREGVMRGFQWRNGQWRDMVLYSKIRGED